MLDGLKQGHPPGLGQLGALDVLGQIALERVVAICCFNFAVDSPLALATSPRLRLPLHP